MKCPILINVPNGQSEDEALPDALLELLREVFPAVTSVFGDNAVIYKLDIGKVYDSVNRGNLTIEGQFVDKSDGELFDFSITQSSNQVGYKSAGKYLGKESLNQWLKYQEIGPVDESSTNDSQSMALYLLIEAISNSSSDAYHSPFAEKLRRDIDYLGALSLGLFRGVISVEAQSLYAALHSYAIQYALRGIKMLNQATQEDIRRESTDLWIETHGVDAATSVIGEFSARRLSELEKDLDSNDAQLRKTINQLLDDAIDMSMAAAREMINSIAKADSYREGDVAEALAAAIEEFCPIDNSEGYQFSDDGLDLSQRWLEVVESTECNEALTLSELGLPSRGRTFENKNEPEVCSDHDSSSTSYANSDGQAERMYYVNVGEGIHRHWDDCKKFGFLAAGGGRKWSKQLEKLQIGDTVIAYLKGYGYVGIGRVTSTSTPATKFTVNGVSIKELPLINNTIRSIKRFSKENGEYLIGVDWDVVVSRDQAAWKPNAGLYTTALVCASLANQLDTVRYVLESLRFYSSTNDRSLSDEPTLTQQTSMNTFELNSPQTCQSTIEWIKKIISDPLHEETNMDDIVSQVVEKPWASENELLEFFKIISIELARTATASSEEETASIFGKSIYYGLSINSPYFRLWELCYRTSSEILQAAISIRDWDTELDKDIGELELISLIPLATAYELPIFESLRNYTLDSLTDSQEEFLGYVAAMLSPGYYDGILPAEILNIPSSKILCEILEYWDQYPDLWTPEHIIGLLSSTYASPYVNQELKDMIKHVLQGNDENDPDRWGEHRAEYWSNVEISEAISLCD
jgi:hypothetical protein